jgi:hypothetical protein
MEVSADNLSLPFSANHLVFCSKQTSYKQKQMQMFIYEEESNASSIDSSVSEEHPRPATIFDALGLVKKKPSDRGIIEFWEYLEDSHLSLMI